MPGGQFSHFRDKLSPARDMTLWINSGTIPAIPGWLASLMHSFNSTYYYASSICYAWLVFMQLTRDLFAIAKFLIVKSNYEAFPINNSMSLRMCS